MTEDTKALIAAQLTAAFFSKHSLAPADVTRSTRLKEIAKDIEPQFSDSAESLAEVQVVYEFFLEQISIKAGR